MTTSATNSILNTDAGDAAMPLSQDTNAICAEHSAAATEAIQNNGEDFELLGNENSSNQENCTSAKEDSNETLFDISCRKLISRVLDYISDVQIQALLFGIVVTSIILALGYFANHVSLAFFDISQMFAIRPLGWLDPRSLVDHQLQEMVSVCTPQRGSLFSGPPELPGYCSRLSGIARLWTGVDWLISASLAALGLKLAQLLWND